MARAMYCMYTVCTTYYACLLYTFFFARADLRARFARADLYVCVCVCVRACACLLFFLFGFEYSRGGYTVLLVLL